MFLGGRITDSLIESLEKLRIAEIKCKWYMMNGKTLYEILEDNGYIVKSYPHKWIDRLAKKNKFVNFFHKPRMTKDERVLEKGHVYVFFDDWHVDVGYGGKYLAFNKEYTTEEIYKAVRKAERTQKQDNVKRKLKRIC